jgi:hypothetical protein
MCSLLNSLTPVNFLCQYVMFLSWWDLSFDSSRPFSGPHTGKALCQGKAGCEGTREETEDGGGGKEPGCDAAKLTVSWRRLCFLGRWACSWGLEKEKNNCNMHTHSFLFVSHTKPNTSATSNRLFCTFECSDVPQKTNWLLMSKIAFPGLQGPSDMYCQFKCAYLKDIFLT